MLSFIAKGKTLRIQIRIKLKVWWTGINYHHNVTEILLKVALNTITPSDVSFSIVIIKICYNLWSFFCHILNYKCSLVNNSTMTSHSLNHDKSFTEPWQVIHRISIKIPIIALSRIYTLVKCQIIKEICLLSIFSHLTQM